MKKSLMYLNVYKYVFYKYKTIYPFKYTHMYREVHAFLFSVNGAD